MNIVRVCIGDISVKPLLTNQKLTFTNARSQNRLFAHKYKDTKFFNIIINPNCVLSGEKKKDHKVNKTKVFH